jgi:hypothetical protein
MAVFWVVAPCSLVEVYQRFRGSCCLRHQGDDCSLKFISARLIFWRCILIVSFHLYRGLVCDNHPLPWFCIFSPSSLPHNYWMRNMN